MPARTGYTILAALLLLISGCSHTIKLSRSKGPFQEFSNSGKSQAPTEGKLILTYEKKLGGSVSSPIQLGKKYIAFNTTRDRFLVLYREDGSRAARIRKSKGIFMKPLVLDSIAVIVKKSPRGQVQLINLFSGRILTSLELNEIRSGPINVGETLIFGTTGGIAAYSIPDLVPIWSQGDQDIVDIDPVALGNKLIYVTGSYQIIMASAHDGKADWSVELDRAVASELSVGRHLYLGLSDGSVVAMDTADGGIIWQESLGQPIRGAVTEDGDRVYFGCTNGKIYCLKADSGTKVWEYQTDGVVTATPVVAGRAVLIGSHDRALYSLDAKTGRLVDRQELEGPVTQAVAIDGRIVYAASGKNRFYCFEVE